MDVQLNKNDPDYEIELFWYGFKQAMINFYKSVDKPCRFVEDWSSILNKFKLEKNYKEIESKIRDYITMYSFHLIKYSKSPSYHNDSILMTNIKRWNRISEKFNFIQSSEHSTLLTLFMIYLEFKKLDRYNFLLALSSIDILIEKNNFDEFLKYSLENDKPKILELLKEIKTYNVVKKINFLYPELKCNQNIRFVKICNEYKAIKSKIDIKTEKEVINA
jgi:hypothetical protein